MSPQGNDNKMSSRMTRCVQGMTAIRMGAEKALVRLNGTKMADIYIYTKKAGLPMRKTIKQLAIEYFHFYTTSIYDKLMCMTKWFVATLESFLYDINEISRTSI